METKLSFRTMLQEYTPSCIKEYVESHMHRSKVSVVDNKLMLELNLEEKNLISKPCLYRWLVPENTAKEILNNKELLEKSAKTEIDGNIYYILYFGKSKNGKTRIESQHLRGNTKRSTLRLTLFSLLYNQDQPAKEWDIEQYFPNTYFEWFAFNKEEEDFIVCIESICVALGAYPLNIEGNPAYKSEWKATLMSLRHNCK